MRSRIVYVLCCLLAAACAGEPQPRDPSQEDPGQGIVLTSQAEVDAYAAQTRAAGGNVSLDRLTIRGEDIDDISAIEVSTVGTLLIEETALIELVNPHLTTVTSSMTLQRNPRLVDAQQLLLTRCEGDIRICDNPYLSDISFLLLLERFKGRLTVSGNPMLGEDRPDKGPSWGFNPILSLLKDGILTSDRVSLADNHAAAATIPMQIGRVAHVARFSKVNTASDYAFGDGVISQEVLENYLSRAITEAEYLHSARYNADGFYGTDDDRRMLLNVGAKFIGRSMYEWGRENYFLAMNDEWFDAAREKMESLHQADPSIIFQAGMFEIATNRVNDVPIPWWVFEAFGKKPEERNFSYDAIRNADGRRINQWGAGTCVPDIANEETQMLYYYKAVRFMEIGIEALHCGQINLICGFGDASAGFPGMQKVLRLIRDYARKYARRSMVLLDAHCNGHVVNGKHLLDFASYPMRLHEVAGSTDMAARVEARYLDGIIGRTRAGTTPSGWYTDRLPYLVEFDNFGTSNHPGSPLDDIFCWGYDEISWIANVSEAYARTFVTQTVAWFDKNDPMGHLEMPGMRFAAGARAEIGGPQVYRCNTAGTACPTGRNLEKTIKTLWQ